MAEVGLLPFARVALDVAKQVLPSYRTRFSKHQFTQPQLLAVLCLMRYEDWTFREAETRLREHQELRAALQLAAVPDYTTLYRFLRRLQDDTVDRGLSETVRRLRRRRRRAVVVAVDGTGLSYNSVSSFFIRRVEQQAQRSSRHRHWLKWVIVVHVQQQILLAQRGHQGPGSDVRFLPPLLDVAARGAPIRRVLADAEFDSEPNHQHIRQCLGAQSIIPAKRRGVPNGEIRNLMFRRFPAKPYRQRVKIETTFSTVKRKLSSRAPGRSLPIQIRQALLLGLAFNIYRLRHPLAHEDVNRATQSILSGRVLTYREGYLVFSALQRLRKYSALVLLRASCVLSSRTIFAEFGRLPFFWRAFSWALRRANSCARQLRGLCFHGSSRTAWVPPIKQPLALGAAALAFGCLRKMGQKKETFSCPTYMLSGIARAEVCPPTFPTLEHGSSYAGHSRNGGLRRQRRRA